MKTTLSVIALGAMLTAFGAAAAARTQDRIPELQREAPKDSSPETLTGCVARGTADGIYLLTNITGGGKDRQATAETFERMSVALSGTDVDVSKHVGHRVSVTGRYETAGLVAPTVWIDARPAAAEAASQVDKRAARTFRITSLAMVSDSCSQPAD